LEFVVSVTFLLSPTFESEVVISTGSSCEDPVLEDLVVLGEVVVIILY